MCTSHGHGLGPQRRRGGWRRFGNRDEWLTRLEEYQRDLEEELADVADIIRRLKEEGPQQAATV